MPLATSDLSHSDIVTDTYLHTVLETCTHAREQCMTLVEAIEATSVAESQQLPLEAQLELSKQQKTLYSYLGQLRGQNRNSILKVRNTKQQTAEARQEIDTLHLRLQNLYYEERHLRGEIAACESYDHKYHRLPLIPVEDFLAKQPERAEDDEKSLMFARIDHEHAEREALEQERQGLLKKKQTLMAENKKRKDDLASLDQDLEKFIDVSLEPSGMFMVYRAGEIAQQALIVFREAVFDTRVIKAETSENEITIHEGDYAEDDVIFPFPNHLFQSQKDKIAVLLWRCCDDASAFTHKLLCKLFTGTGHTRYEVQLLAKRNKLKFSKYACTGQLNVKSHDEHSVLKIRLYNGEVLAMDLSGPQYGYFDHPVMPWDAYMKTRVREVRQIDSSGTTLVSLAIQRHQNSLLGRLLTVFCHVSDTLFDLLSASSIRPLESLVKLPNKEYSTASKVIIYAAKAQLFLYGSDLERTNGPHWWKFIDKDITSMGLDDFINREVQCEMIKDLTSVLLSGGKIDRKTISRIRKNPEGMGIQWEGSEIEQDTTYESQLQSLMSSPGVRIVDFSRL
ncbi:uncharacterized protein KY384_001937 [Bacidia gigantensis]|uniref:uncharacterized protein n=1 Tax=Bacidia gigantensis TaxID=2732470 RepID=UPI001D057C7A|nr:uncharacterized protein KY384_001937 [Bacidia gigantensis]KAG8533154.1 hypothetical protein KY384_001937 [Bacidia gigantensis]